MVPGEFRQGDGPWFAPGLGGFNSADAARLTPVLTDLQWVRDQAVRLFARELGVDLTRVSGSARKGRITREVPPEVARDRSLIDEFVGMA